MASAIGVNSEYSFDILAKACLHLAAGQGISQLVVARRDTVEHILETHRPHLKRSRYGHRFNTFSRIRLIEAEQPAQQPFRLHLFHVVRRGHSPQHLRRLMKQPVDQQAGRFRRIPAGMLRQQPGPHRLEMAAQCGHRRNGGPFRPATRETGNGLVHDGPGGCGGGFRVARPSSATRSRSARS